LWFGVEVLIEGIINIKLELKSFLSI